MKIDFVATAHQYAEHLRPVWEALPDDERGEFVLKKNNRSRRIELTGDLVVVNSYADYKAVCKTRLVTTIDAVAKLRIEPPPVPVAFMEHGAGFTYLPNPRKPAWGGSYAGGPNRDHVSIFPSTNRWVREANLARNPNVPAPIVGCPKLDALAALPDPGNDHPVIAFSFHWDCPVWPETRSAWPHYYEHLFDFAREAEARGWEIIGHGHPRVGPTLQFWWKKLGWEYVPDFADVCARADVYVCDTSSTIYEFAALDRPVVLLDAPWYRRDVQHGLRFWSHADVGVRIGEPEDLTWAIEEALADEPLQRDQRRWAISEVYPYLGESVPRTIAVLRDFMEESSA